MREDHSVAPPDIVPPRRERAPTPDARAASAPPQLLAVERAEDRALGTPPAPETRERELAWERGRRRKQEAPRPGMRTLPAAHVAPMALHAGRIATRAFPALAENVRDYAIFLLDPDGIITYWGEGARLVKWWMKEEAEGGHLRMLYPEGGAEDGTAEQHLVEAAATGESVSEGHRVRRDGSTFWASVTLTALRDEDGTLLGFAKVTRDLTAQRVAEATLAAAADAERARSAAEAVSEAKSRFVATMSHEVRTPINAVLGYADLLAAELEGPLTPGQRGYLERLRTSARHLLGLVEDVLDLSRMDAGHLPVEREVGQLGEVVAASLALLEPLAQQRGVVLEDRIGTHAASLTYLGDATRVRQVLVNLLSNAVKFAEARAGAPAMVIVSGGAALDATAGVRPAGEGPWAYVRVEDSGPGIPADQLAQIFEPFVQVGRQHNRPVEGAGLGLTISRQLARRMGGEITVESEVGTGSAFMLWLPLAPVASLLNGA